MVPLQACGGQLSELTQRMARLGAGGKFPNNVERDLANLLQVPIQPYWIQIPVKDATRKEVTSMRCPTLLPHEVYHYLYEPSLGLTVSFLLPVFKVVSVLFPPKRLLLFFGGYAPRPVGSFVLIRQRSKNFGTTRMTPHTRAQKD